jgi:hypothetical protein
LPASSLAQETAAPDTLEVRDALRVLNRTHNRNQDLSFRIYAGIASQFPLSGFADAINRTSRSDIRPFQPLAAWFYEVRPALSLFYHLEMMVLLSAGFWGLEVNVDPVLHRTLTLEQTLLQVGGGLKYRILKGDIVPFVCGLGGLGLSTLNLFQNYTPLRNEQVKANLIFFGGSAGVDFFVSEHWGASFQLAYIYYGNVTQFQTFRDPFITHQASFPSYWGNLMVSTHMFYEF